MMRIGRLIGPLTAAAAMVGMSPELVRACAVCGLPPGDHEAHAFNTSVLFLMAVPYSICLIGAVVGYVAYRNACKRRQAAIDSRMFPPGR